MSSLRRARAAAAAADDELSLSLPNPLWQRIWGALPPHERARCACVCRAWRAAVLDQSLWLRLDLTRAGGVPRALATEALLRGAAALARGHLQLLAAPGSPNLRHAVLDVAAASAGSLRELYHGVAPCGSVEEALRPADVEALLRAAPALACHVAMVCTDFDDVRRCGPMLRGEPPFAALRVHDLKVSCPLVEEWVLRLAADVAACQHGTLAGLRLHRAHLNSIAAADALVDALLAQRCSALALTHCYTTPASASRLARLLRGGALTYLTISHDNEALLDAPAAALLAGALRECPALRSLELCRVRVLRDAQVAAALLPALTAHPGLRRLVLNDDIYGSCDDATAARLGALVAANSPLEHLVVDLGLNHRGEEWLRPLLEALPRNTRLRELLCGFHHVSEAFAHDALLPAVRANAGLRCLSPIWRGTGIHFAPSLVEAMALVDRRARDADAAP